MKSPDFEMRVRSAILKYDPVFACIDPANQQDEYDMEMPAIIQAIKNSPDSNHLRKKLRQIFVEKVGFFEAGTKFRYTKLANELLRLEETCITPK